MGKKHMTIRILNEEDFPKEGTSFLMWKSIQDQHFVVVKSKGWTLQEAENPPIVLEEEKEYYIKKNMHYSFNQGVGSLVFGVIENE